MDLEFISFNKLEIAMKVTGSMIKEMDMENILGSKFIYLKKNI